MRCPVEPDRAAFLAMFAASADHLAPWMPTLAELGGSPDAYFDRQLARAALEWRAGTGCRLVAFLPSGEVVGTFNLNNIVRGVFQNADAGWNVSASHLRKGFATECVHALLSFAFTPESRGGLGLHRVQAGIIPRNTASLGVANKLGLRHEGLALRYLRINGVWEDHALFATTAEEWPAQPPPPKSTPPRGRAGR
jgi:ribosomal-protein-alanine N-acetyltransferase